MKKKIYISGKITGDRDFKQKFKIVEEKLKAKGYAVLNPADLPDGLSQKEYMLLGTLMLSFADAVYLLSDYQDSPGALAEYAYAIKLKLPFMDKHTEFPTEFPLHQITEE